MRAMVNGMDVSSIPTQGSEIFKIFPLFGNKAKRDVEFPHSTRSASKIQRKVGNRVLTQVPPPASAYPAIFGIHSEAEIKK